MGYAAPPDAQSVASVWVPRQTLVEAMSHLVLSNRVLGEFVQV